MAESSGRARWRALGIYQKFDHTVFVFLTGLIAVVIVAALWNLTLQILFSLVSAERSTVDPAELTERYSSIFQVRTVVLLVMVAMVRKLIILGLATTDPPHLFALAAAMAALGGVYWSVCDQDGRERPLPG